MFFTLMRNHRFLLSVLSSDLHISLLIFVNIMPRFLLNFKDLTKHQYLRDRYGSGSVLAIMFDMYRCVVNKTDDVKIGN